jgi:hypothetical protein
MLASKTGTPTVTGVLAGNGKWSGGSPPSGPIYQRCTGAPAPRATQIGFRVARRPALLQGRGACANSAMRCGVIKHPCLIPARTRVDRHVVARDEPVAIDLP